MKRALLLLVLVACTKDKAEDSVQSLCISDVNKFREMNGAAAVERSSTLQAFATEGAEVDFGSTSGMHFGTDGGGVALAENDCPQQDGWTVDQGETQKTVVSQCIQTFYDEGLGGAHYTNLMGDYAYAGCGVYQQDAAITIIVDFAN